MNNFENLNAAQSMPSSNSSGTPSVGPKATGSIPSGYQYINKQVNNVKLVNNNSLTLNVRNFNNRISNININNINEENPKAMTLQVQSMAPSQTIKTQRYSRENSL
jgi:hypothetical protein